MRSLEQLDRWIAGKVKEWTTRVSGAPPARELLEVRRDLLEDVRDRIEPRGQGKSLFPYNSIAVRVAARDSAELAVRRAAFAEPGGLEDDIRALLREGGCTLPAGFAVQVDVVEDPAMAGSSRPFDVVYSNPARKLAAPTRPTLRLTIVRGDADETDYTLAADRVNIGRLKEVVGEKDGLRRRNDVAFAETETTVSREHASIRYDPENGKFRLYDSGSQRGTSVFREGRRLEAPRARGVQLQPGDEIHVGDARVRFDILG